MTRPNTAPAGQLAPAGAVPRHAIPHPTPEPQATAPCQATASSRVPTPGAAAGGVVPRPRTGADPYAPVSAQEPAPGRGADERAGPVRAVRVGTRVVRGQGGRTTVVDLAGELDLVGAPDVARALAYALDHVGPRVVVDMTDVSFADTSGLGPVAGMSDRAREAGGRLVLVGAGAMVQRVLHSIGHRPAVYRTERDALLGRLP